MSTPTERLRSAKPAQAAKGPERDRHEQALLRQRRRMRRADLEFLPAALEVLETPPSPVRLAVMATIALLATAALAWAFFGRVDVVAIAQGKIQAIGRTKVIQPLETGRVRAIEVVNGQAVKAGDVLVTLDPSVSEADERTLAATLAAFDAEAQRRRAALGAVTPGQRPVAPTVAWTSDVPPNIAVREQRVLDNDIGQLAAVLASLSATAREKTAERDRLTATIEVQQRLVAILKDRVGMRSVLMDRAAGSKSSLMDSQETLETQQAYLANLRGQAATIVEAIETVRLDIDKAYRAFLLDNSQKLSDAERQVEDSRAKLDKARLITSHAVLRSPIDGVVQGLSVVTTGQVVQTGERIMDVVPSTGLEIESYLPNADVGFVAVGQPAIVKVEAFPFTRYGMLDGVVTHVAADAIPEADARQREESPSRGGAPMATGGAQRLQNLVFPMNLTISGSLTGVDGQPIRLMPGMAVTVEIKTGSRRIIEFILSPLTEVTSRSLRER